MFSFDSVFTVLSPDGLHQHVAILFLTVQLAQGLQYGSLAQVHKHTHKRKNNYSVLIIVNTVRWH